MEVRFNAFFLLCWLTELFPNKNVYAEFWPFSFMGNGTGIVFSSANTSAEEKKQKHPNNRNFLSISLEAVVNSLEFRGAFERDQVNFLLESMHASIEF